MALKVAVQMDPIQSINITGDSTFAMMLEAQRRGHSLFYYQTKTLALGSGSLFATGSDITVRDEKGNHYTLGDERRAALLQHLNDLQTLSEPELIEQRYAKFRRMGRFLEAGTQDPSLSS